MMFMFSVFIMIVGVLLSVAFFTLMERKIMGLMHYRKGPNKLILVGVTQPMSDAVKLLTKSMVKMSFSKMSMYMMGPSVAMVLMMLCWSWVETWFQNMSKSGITMMVLFAIMSLTPYVFILTGWGGNNKYTIMGSLRAISQVISYEVCLILFSLCVIYITMVYKVSIIMSMQKSYWMLCMNLPLFLTWLMMCMSESNRTPFDHAESESELVSGFNLEHNSGMFAIIFIAEYGMILVLSIITCMMFSSNSMMLLKIICMCFMFVWVRCSLPRMRYDKLMMMSWKICLPYSLSLITISMCT